LPSRSAPSVPPARSRGLTSPRLRRLAQRAHEDRGAPEQQEQCDLCGAPLPGSHRHLLDVQSRELLCACRACSLLFDRSAAGAGHYRLIPERRIRLDRFELADPTWESFRIPVDLAFFFHSSAAGRVTAFYPSPMGPTESRLELSTWEELEQSNPILRGMEEDIEALLVDRSRGVRRQWLVPIDDCYRLVAVIRTRWRGFTGGKDVWLEIDRFFAGLDEIALSQDAQPETPFAERR
jgi:hypothetical protein